LVGQVENLREHFGVGNFGANAVNRILGLGFGAGWQDHLRTVSGEFKRGMEADATVGTGDDDTASLLRGDAAGGPRSLHIRSMLPLVSTGNKAPIERVLTLR